FGTMIRKRGGWLCALFVSEMLTATAMQHFEGQLSRAIVLTLFIPLIMSSGGNSGSQATSLIIRALALREVRVRDWWWVAMRELPTGVTLGVILGAIGIARIVSWQLFGFYNYGPHWVLVALAGTERRRIEEAAALRRDDLHAPGPGALALARRARLVDEQRPALAVDDHREGRLAADLGPARFEQPQRAGVGEDDHRVVFG